MRKLFRKLLNWFKTTYAYYYYLCFKEFIIKLLKPKRMITVKWRYSSDIPYEFYTEIEDSMFYKSSPLIYQAEYNGDNSVYELLIENRDARIRQDEIKFRPVQSFRIISNDDNVDYILTYNQNHERELFDTKVIKIIINDIESDDFDINTISKNKHQAILSYINQSVGFIDNSETDLIEICENTDDLIKKEVEIFINFFRIRK